MRSTMPLFGEATASVSGATQPSKVDSASCSECNASAAYASSGRRIRARLKSRRASVHRPLMQLPFQFGDVGQRRCVLAWLCLVVSQPSAIAVVFVTLPPRSLTNLVGTSDCASSYRRRWRRFSFGPSSTILSIWTKESPQAYARPSRPKQLQSSWRSEAAPGGLLFFVLDARATRTTGAITKACIVMLPTLTMPPIKNWISMIIPCEIAGCPHARLKLAGRIEKREGLP